ncbi:MAG: fibrobacter succinogenes major paralogous domain-containing protein [Bacteroidales bacterium]|nr:fibrobacter succinogenes major paralogous domain-containing protein [Bacteroidales bacterium]
MKKLLFTICLCWSVLSMTAQTTETAYAFPVGGATVGNTYAAIGLPFYEQVASGTIEVDLGVAHALLVTQEVTGETCENVDYTGNGFNLPAPLTPGTSEHSRYEVNGAPLNYDLRTILTLTVYPIYEVYDTMMYHGEMPSGIVEGDNNLALLTIHGCDSLVHLYALLCPYTVNDADDTVYNTVVMNNRYCWTQRNLKAVHYTDNSDVASALVYTSSLSPDADANLETFGRLYTWYSAMNVSEDGSETPVADSYGFNQGVCPTGWHIPTAVEMNALHTYAAADLNSTEEWLGPIANTNSTGFSALPAGFYNAQTNRFEDLHTHTNFWSASSTTSTTFPEALTFMLEGHCAESLLINEPTSNAYSVRCVKDYQY